jgi:predicted acylesterase/phospholipase RssA/ABC-type phosphate/phosphonate transport system substrate-binding protein
MRSPTTFVLTLAALLLLCDGASAQRTFEISVGITEYQNIEPTYARYQTLFRQLSGLAGGDSVTFRIAVGTYEEVIDWYNRNQIDIAVLSATPMAELLMSSREERDQNGRTTKDRIRDAYIGTLRAEPVETRAECHDGLSFRRLFEDIYSGPDIRGPKEPGAPYRTVCVVPRDSPLNAISELKDHKAKKELKFLFVRPPSASGFIFPAYHLNRELAIDINDEEYEFTYQHSNTLRKLIESQQGRDDAGRYLVGFVLDTTSYCIRDSDAQGGLFKRLVFPDLDDERIPSEAVLMNYRSRSYSECRDLMIRLFKISKESDGLHRSAFSFDPLPEDKSEAEKTLNDWLSSYDRLKLAIRSTNKTGSFPYRFTVDEVLDNLATYKDNYEQDMKDPDKQSTAKPPRIALVLSGGGAKCAYQAGALDSLEEKLTERRMDIDLVVGTSGGAINALFAAMKLCESEEGRTCFESTWRAFKQQDFFQPPIGINIVVGLAFGVLQALCVVIVTLIFGRNLMTQRTLGKVLVGLVLIEAGVSLYFNHLHIVPVPVATLILGQVLSILCVATLLRQLRGKLPNWWTQSSLLMLTVCAIDALLSLWEGPQVWPLGLDENHLFQHLWLTIRLFSRWSALPPLLLSSIFWLAGRRGALGRFCSQHPLRLTVLLTACLLMVCTGSLLYSLLKEDSPTGAVGIERKFIEEFPKLTRCIGRPLPLATSPDIRKQLQDISEQIQSNRIFRRDLVVTASRLPVEDTYDTQTKRIGTLANTSADELPMDLYFYFRRDEDEHLNVPLPPPGKQFISLRDINKNNILNIVIGSGTIYPLFPPREVGKVKVDTGVVDRIQIVDGGFIHNNPIDAALKWGATHIILIEASAKSRPFAPHHLLDNSLEALAFLFSQAQNLDTAVRGSVEMFELRPTSQCDKLSKEYKCDDDPEPNLDAFDFSPTLLRQAFEQGRKDVISKNALFARVSGPPVFRETGLPRRGISASPVQ